MSLHRDCGLKEELTQTGIMAYLQPNLTAAELS